jgi:hypothetical protein
MKFSMVNANFKRRKEKRKKNDNNNKLLPKAPQMMSQMEGGAMTFSMSLWKLVFHC